MTDTIQISIPAGFIDAAMCAVSKEETRYYLKGVFIDARGFIAATNGLMAFAARCNDAYKLAGVSPTYPSDALSGVIVPSDAILQAGKAAGRSKGLCYVIERDAQGLWWILYGNARIHFAPVDGSFPDWARIIPAAPDALVAAHYQPQYIGKLGDMAKALRDGKKDAASQFKLHQNGENPALVTFASEDGQGQRTDCCGVLVPMREKGESAFDRDAFIAA
jgi:hypothetical protein